MHTSMPTPTKRLGSETALIGWRLKATSLPSYGSGSTTTSAFLAGWTNHSGLPSSSYGDRNLDFSEVLLTYIEARTEIVRSAAVLEEIFFGGKSAARGGVPI